MHIHTYVCQDMIKLLKLYVFAIAIFNFFSAHFLETEGYIYW